MSSIDKQVERLVTLSLAELKEEWSVWFEGPTPRLSPNLMRHALAYALQEKAFGKLPRLIARQIEGKGKPSSQARIVMRPGVQLVRSWNGKTISVDVTETGFVFEDKTYRSLSSIAREVTGVQWSGPRFFGLNSHGR